MKINRMLSIVAVGAVGAGLLPVLTATAASADTSNQDFESFTLGSPNGQNGWQMTGAYDAAIVDPSAAWGTAFGDRALRISNAVTSGSFGDHLFSASNADEAGESSAQSNGLSGGTRQSRFTSSFSFGSADPDTTQTGLNIGISPDRGDGARMGLVRIYDEADGLKVTVWTVSYDGADFDEVTVASGLSRTAKHTLTMVEDFKDGENNDSFSVSVDGSDPVFGSSWEQYFRNAEHNPTRTVDSLLFRPTSPAAPALAGKGLLIDDLVTTTGATPPLAPCPVTIDSGSKTLTMTGDCTTTSTLTVPDGWTLDGAGHTITAVDTATGPDFTGAVLQNADVADASMSITDVHVVGDFNDGCSGSLFGVRFQAASGSFTNSTVENIRYGAAGSGCQGGNSVDVNNLNGSGQPINSARQAVTVEGVDVTGFQKTGIRANGKVSLTLKDSTVADAELDMVTASNSIQIGRGARATVSGNTIAGNDYDKDPTSATAVLLYGAGDVTFTRNVITGTDTDFGVYAYEDSTYPAGHLSLTCNLIGRSAAADSTGGALDLYNTAVSVDGSLAGTVDAAGNTVRGFATGFDGVTNAVGGDCASGPVNALTTTGTTTSLTVDWAAPTALDYAPVTSYEVTLQPGGLKQTVTATEATFTGLEAGRTYTATVVPVNAAGKGEAASVSAYATSSTIKASATKVSSGKKVTITGKVTDKDTGKPVAGQTVTLWSHVQGVTTYTVVRTGTSAADGSFSFSVTETRSRYFYVTTEGPGHLGSTSGKIKVAATGRASIALSKSTVKMGQTVTFSGSVRPKTGVKVELQRKVGTKWVTVKTTTPAAAGTYAVSWKTDSTTDYAWRVRVSGPSISAAASVAKVLKVS